MICIVDIFPLCRHSQCRIRPRHLLHHCAPIHWSSPFSYLLHYQLLHSLLFALSDTIPKLTQVQRKFAHQCEILRISCRPGESSSTPAAAFRARCNVPCAHIWSHFSVTPDIQCQINGPDSSQRLVNLSLNFLSHAAQVIAYCDAGGWNVSAVHKRHEMCRNDSLSTTNKGKLQSMIRY